MNLPRLTNFQLFPVDAKWRWRVSVAINNRVFSDVEGWGNTFQEAHTMAWDEAMKYDTDDLPGRERRDPARGERKRDNGVADTTT